MYIINIIKMKKLTDCISALFMVLLALLCLVSCEIDDNKKAWGEAKIYMPQSSMLSAGRDNNYYVPLSNASTQNYIIDEETNTLKIALGVYRSGLQKLDSYSVKVFVDTDATNEV